MTVAKGLDAPIKLLFPRVYNATATAVVDAVNATLASNATATAVARNWAGERLEFSLLGLGDIVVPGFLVSLLLRFDASRAHVIRGAFPKPYFLAVLLGYVAGIAATVWVMEVFKAAQPALLYLVPACLGTTLALALVRGELAELLAYDEEVAQSPQGSGAASDEAASSEPVASESKKVK